jgi:hypothetical protein
MIKNSVNAHLWPLDRSSVNGDSRYGLRLERTGYADTQIWYQVPEPLAASVTDRCDPFLVAVLFHLMQAGSHVHVHGAVTRSLVRNLQRFMEVTLAWWPTRCFPVEIEADALLPDRTATRDESIMLYSGGLDARSAFHWHRMKKSREYIPPISNAILVRGLNIRLDEESKYELAFNAAQRSLVKYGVPLHRVATNWFNETPFWPDSHGTLLGSLLQLFEGTFAAGVLGSSSTYFDLDPWGAHPLLDRWLGSDSMPVRVDDYRLSRLGKSAFLAQIEGATDGLLVCHYFDERGNCGSCEKCLRTALGFIASGNAVPPELNIAAPIDRSVATKNMGRVNFSGSMEVIEASLARFHEDHSLRRRYPRIYRKLRALVIQKHAQALIGSLPLVWRLNRFFGVG